MKLDIKQVEHIAKLARLGLSKKEKEKFSEQLSSVLGYVKKLNKVDTEKTEPTSHITGLTNITRQDVAEEVDQEVKDALLKEAPEIEDGLVKTKSVFK